VRNAISWTRIAAVASAVVLGLASAGARADIFAATCVADPSGTGQDVAVLNATTGARVALPAVVNGTDTELDPSINIDGTRLLLRRTSPTGVNRLLLVDLVTGASADLFTGLEVSQNPIFGSALAGNSLVFTGRRFPALLGFAYPRVFLTSVGGLTSGPFSHETLAATRFNYRNPGVVNDVAVGGGNRFVMEVGGLLGSLVLNSRSGGGGSGGVINPPTISSSLPLRSASADYSQAALAADDGQRVYFKQRLVVGGVFQDGDIAFRPATTLADFPGTPTRVLGGVSTSAEESQPALTSDARYLAFVRGTFGANDRLFVWNPLTQTMLNPNGVDLGLRDSSSSCGSLSLYTRSVLSSGVISRTGNVNATLLQASSIGIFVQRILGKTEVDGQKGYELETVGRFPLGSYGEGNVFTQWDFTVDGAPLPPGRYLVTLRAVEGTIVRELGESQVLRIGEDGSVRFASDPKP